MEYVQTVNSNFFKKKKIKNIKFLLTNKKEQYIISISVMITVIDIGKEIKYKEQ